MGIDLTARLALAVPSRCEIIAGPLTGYRILDFEKIDQRIEVGYRYAMERIAAWLESGA